MTSNYNNVNVSCKIASFMMPCLLDTCLPLAVVEQEDLAMYFPSSCQWRFGSKEEDALTCKSGS